MNRADLIARLQASESPAVWLLATATCRAARRLSRHRSRWSSRLGYALERLDTAREARRESLGERSWSAVARREGGDATHYLRAARRRERRGDWSGAATAYRQVVRDECAHAPWWLRLGWCLHQSGDLAGAAHAVRKACAFDPTDPRWFGLLGDIEKALGDLPAAATAYDQAVRLGGDTDPRWRLRLADLHDHVGQWAEARQVLQEVVTQAPGHALGHRRLGEICLSQAQWGGSFTGTVSGRSAGTFRFDQPSQEPAELARQALERAAELEPAKTAWRTALAEARLADGDNRGAAALFEAALRDAEESTGRWVLAVKHRWQFQVESIYHRLGEARVEDPLFDCTVEPGEPVVQQRPFVGLFNARTTFAGLAITGMVAANNCDQVEIIVGGTPLRTVNLGGDGYFPQFALEVKRATLASFPRHTEIEVRAPDGARLHAPGGADRIRVSVPHGDGRLAGIIAAGGKLDKKGVISPSLEETQLRQQRYLEIYARVRDFFEQVLGRPPFLMYGTLLGIYRDGAFIPGDDDFDAGYVSDEADPLAVKEETKRLIIELVRAGFTVSFNRKGRLFRIQLEREATDGFHLDMRPLWFQDGNVWVHNHCSFPSSRDDFLPVVESELRGIRVFLPRNTEAFLRGHYGPGWKVPDPGFMYYLSEIDPGILDNLSRALITVREYKELAERIRREVGTSATAGRFVSVGSQDLYPLTEFLA